ncbi:hypothetical protein SAMN02745202_00144 [Segatella oulorum]|uniref:Uncharacterized protein n=1 Tax=Segatella oulorum TaxID=28136 RepID=A0A1T4KPB8_9BACT|nr:hypothetical protein SAMN02745202_00144 [Segatella oulorum]
MVKLLCRDGLAISIKSFGNLVQIVAQYSPFYPVIWATFLSYC